MRKSIVLFTAVLFLGAGCASMQGTAVVPSARTGMMASKITEAEYLGAQKCSPMALAKAKIAVDHVTPRGAGGILPPGVAGAGPGEGGEGGRGSPGGEEIRGEPRASSSQRPDIPTGPDGSCSHLGG